tara:strand:+ start:386 stop:745 length:360 start_codon:yes stop_codon:yes gene_type:complete
MSTIKVTTIQDTSGGNSSTSEEIFEGRAKAWVNFDGTGTVTIRDDYNVSSITDAGAGSYTLNFTSAMTSANYAAVGMSHYGIYARTASPHSTTAFHVGTFNTTNASNTDYDYAYVAIFD